MAEARHLLVEQKVAIDWHLLEAIENEAFVNGIHVNQIVNSAIANWVADNVSGYYDAAQEEIRRMENSAVWESREPCYPEWMHPDDVKDRVQQLAALGARWKRESETEGA